MTIMPSKSRSQQRLFCMALAVRHGHLKRSEVHKEVLDIVDSDMTDKQIKDFTVRESDGLISLTDYLTESYTYNTKYAAKTDVNGKFDPDRHIFVVVKPGFLTRATEIIEKYERAGFVLEATRAKHLTLNEARRMYYTHKDEPWYNALCKYMASDTCYGLLFRYPGMDTKEAFKKCDQLKDKIRKQWQEDDKRNVMHSSDNATNMQKESKIFFNV